GATRGSAMPEIAPALRRRVESPTSETRPVRYLLIGFTLVVLAIFLVLPLVAVFAQALSLGIGPALDTFRNPEAVNAILLTLLVAAVAVPCNLIFGIAASWAIAKYRFWGRSFLVTLIDLPFSVSP